MDLGFSGQKFTWSNNKGIQQRVWKRLDRALVSDAWLEKMPQTTITHLPSVQSDHCPLLMEMSAREDDHIRYFKFLNRWTDQPNFLDIVRACWERTVEGNNMWKFHQKLKRLSNTLSTWSRKKFGDIFTRVKEYEEKAKTVGEQLIQDHSETNRTILHEINAKYIRFLKIEDSILKQKTQLQWFKEGDCNTKYFHSMIRGRIRRLFIHKLIREDGEWIQGDDVIAEAACDHFQKIFTGDNKFINEGALDCIPLMINQEQNDMILFSSLLEEKNSYEQSSDQLVNIDKSHFIVHSCAFHSTRDRIKRITGFKQKEGPITYLGCPLFVGRPRIIYFSDLINKVLCRITGWQTKLLSYGGRATLVKHVLHSLPIHLLASVTPPRNERKKYHWSLWKNLSFPYDEGGVGMRNLKDVCLSFQYKQWWIFRSKQTLWGDFLKAKYCQRPNPISKKWDT
ncbi:hypothetical protein H5410_027645 [Solanum commersonii]|uniref:Reverse transcriptase n=1 Tax=Solanum commersonii TaxID=4109 RepID=A0A9J5YZR8_SOLCO|nr:hypothetical protein H5410_027645 [Solanum commersonii]